MDNFADILKKITAVGAHIVEVVAEHPEAAEAIVQMVMAATGAAVVKK